MSTGYTKGFNLNLRVVAGRMISTKKELL